MVSKMFFRRIGAYILDMIIVFLIISIVGMFMPSDKNLENNLANQLNDMFHTEKVSDEDLEELRETTYELAKSGVGLSIITIGVYFLYFAILPIYNNGKTLGKMVTKIRIKSTVGEELSLWQTSVRGFFINQYLFDFINLIFIVILTKKNYFNISSPLSSIQSILFIICFLSIIFNKGIGIHDFFSKTIVVLDEDSIEEIEETKADEWKQVKKTRKNSINSARVKNHTKRKGE